MMQDLGGCIRLAGTACAEQIRQLRKEGVIKGYRAGLDWNRLGLPINALFRISAAEAHGKARLKAFRERQDDIEGVGVTGADSYLAHILARSRGAGGGH